MSNKQKKQFLPLTNLGPKPGDFPLASMKSRVAARSQLEQIDRVRKKKMYRVYENGVLVVECEHDWDIEGDVTVRVNRIGRCAEDVIEPVETSCLASRLPNEPQESHP